MRLSIRSALALAMGATLGLAGCGVSGPPIPPNQVAPSPQSGVHISGEARIGVVTK